MRKKIIRAVFITVMILMSAGCSADKVVDNGVYQIYYMDKDGYGLIPEEYQLPQAKQDLLSVVNVLIAQLKYPVSKGEKSPIDEGIDIVDIQLKDNQISVSFSAGYNNKSGVDEILSRAAIVKTLCQLKEIEFVEFYVEDQPLMVGGNAVGLMCGEDFLEEINPEDKEQSKTVSLYFSDKQGTRLQKTTRKITYNKAEPLAKLLVQTLIDGPEEWEDAVETNLYAALPQETVLNSITIRDNICYLDLSKEFLENESPANASIRVYSVVDTLCELPNISWVQFSFDGVKKDAFGDVKGFDLPLQRNLELVADENGGSR